MSPREEQSTKQDLIDATIRVTNQNGFEAASVRSIVREAGLTEAALYWHYKSKNELWRDIYTRIVEAMAEDKLALVHSDEPFELRLSEWVRLTYTYYDGNRDAFNYVLMAPEPVARSFGEAYTRHSQLFTRLYEHAKVQGQVRDIQPELATAMFSGVLLGVPQMINQGRLKAPALKYSKEVADAALRLLRAGE